MQDLTEGSFWYTAEVSFWYIEMYRKCRGCRNGTLQLLIKMGREGTRMDNKEGWVGSHMGKEGGEGNPVRLNLVSLPL